MPSSTKLEIAGHVLLAGAIWIIFIAFAGCYPGGLLEGPKIPPALAPVITECKQPVEDNFVALVGDALAGADYQADLAKLVGQTSLCAVRVAIQKVIDSYAGVKAAVASPVVQRGNEWLLAHPFGAARNVVFI